MSKGLPYFRWYPADAETDEAYAGMTDAELGFYHRALNRSWINNGLPADLDELAKMMRVTRRYVDRMWPNVRRCWQERDGRLFNRRQEEERQHATTKSERATDSVRKRYERSSNVLPRAQARADSDSVSDSSSHEVLVFVPPRKAHVLDEAFMLFMSEVALTETPLIEADYEDAYGDWKHLDSGEQMAAVRSFREKREAGMFADPALVMRPAKWLKRKEFNRRAIQARGSPAASPKLTALDRLIQKSRT